MLLLGLILLVLGLLIPAVKFLFILGIVLIVIGAVIYLIPPTGGGSRRFYW